ncbi:MAG: ERF family protein [Sarcina sp.]
MNVIQKIIECRKAIDKVVKNTKGHGYNYVSGSQLLEKIRPKMDELGLLLSIDTKNVSWETFDYTNAKQEPKTDFIVTGEVVYTWINAEEPSDTLVNKFNVFGQQNDISKAFGSGLTYSERYFILKMLQAPTDSDDPDAQDTTGRKSTKSYSSVEKNYKCSTCNAAISENVYKYSIQKRNKALCMECQKIIN